MKFLFHFILALSSILSLTAHAQFQDNADEIRFEISEAKEARQVYQYLGLPIDWGNKETGKPHSYKYFSDKTGVASIYADVISGSPRIVVRIKKVESTDIVEVSHDAEKSRVMLYDTIDAEKLFAALLVAETQHGGYVIRTLQTDAMDFSISCVKDLANGTGTFCQILAFKEKIPGTY